ncbi:hypothetical protein Ancab_013708 [Ancistrocladus abbreviatus]
MVGFQELIPGFPEEIALDILTRLHYTTYLAARSVCRRWRHLLKSRQFYYHRKQTGHTHLGACFIQSVTPPLAETESDGSKSDGPPTMGISFFDSVSQNWERVDHVPGYPDGLPLFCQVSGSEGKLVVMGGWDPVSYEPVKDVFVYDFITRRWRRGKNMPSKRSLFAIGAINGKIFIAGGHDEEKNALTSAWVYDTEEDEWYELTQMNEERDECQGLVIGSEFWVVSGYDTANQGIFKQSAEAYDAGLNQWRKVENAWDTCQNPRLVIGTGKGRRLFNWAESDSVSLVGTCAIELGNRSLVNGSIYPAEIRGFFIAEKDENGEYAKRHSLAVIKNNRTSMVPGSRKINDVKWN